MGLPGPDEWRAAQDALQQPRTADRGAPDAAPTGRDQP